MVSAWIGNGVVMPSRARASTRSAARPSPSKVGFMEEVLAFVVCVRNECPETPARTWVLAVGRASWLPYNSAFATHNDKRLSLDPRAPQRCSHRPFYPLRGPLRGT